MKGLTQYDWLGNVRELENAIERAVVLADSEVIDPDDLLYYGLSVNEPLRLTPDNVKRLIDVEREHIIKTYKTFEGHIGKSAEALGIDRKTLRLKLQKYRINEKPMG